MAENIKTHRINHVRTWDAPLHQRGMEVPTITSSVALTIPAGATIAMFSVDTQAVYMRTDGIAASPSTGHLLPTGTFLWYSGALDDLRFVQATSGGRLAVSYFSEQPDTEYS